MSVIIALLPALTLIGGAILYLTPFPFPTRFRNSIPLLANALALAALVILARAGGAPTLFEPSDVLPGLSLTIQWNGAALSLGILVLFLTSARLCLGIPDDPPSFTVGTLVLQSSALLFLAADNWTTIAAAWVLVELALLIVPDDGATDRNRVTRAFGWNLAAIVAWLTAGMMVSNEGGSLRLEEAVVQGTASLLTLFAIWIRGGLYPFQVAAPTGIAGAGVRLGIPFLLGGFLMTRFLVSARGGMPFSNEIQIIVVVALGICALVVTAQPHGEDALIWVLRAAGAGLLLLPFFVSARFAPALSAWFTAGLFALCSLLAIAWLWRAQLTRIPLAMIIWIMVLVLAAMLPFAPGFWGRAGLVLGAYNEGIDFWLLLAATMSLMLIPIWREAFASRDLAPRAPSLFEIGAFATAVLPTIFYGLAPLITIAPLGPAVRQSGELAIGSLVQPSGLGPLVFLVGGFVIPLLASFELARRWAPRVSLLPTQLGGVLDLSGLARALDSLYHVLRVLVQQSISLLEQPPIAWLVFLAIWVAVWLRSLGS